MEFRQLQTFVRIARLQSFSGAARQLGYSQSAVTVQIRLLEEELGTHLFDRMGRRVFLTPDGRKFLEHAERILYEAQRAKESMAESGELKNPLRIGTLESLCEARLPSVLSAFRRAHPKAEIQITVGSTQELIRGMEHDDLDLIDLLDEPRWSENWVKAFEAEEPVVFVTGAGAALSRAEGIGLADLTRQPFFLTEKNANYRQALDRFLEEKQIALNPVLECSNTALIIRMLEEGDGVSFLPDLAVRQEIRTGRLVPLEVPDISICMYRQVFYHKNKYLTREMEEYIRLLSAPASEQETKMFI